MPKQELEVALAKLVAAESFSVACRPMPPTVQTRAGAGCGLCKLQRLFSRRIRSAPPPLLADLQSLTTTLCQKFQLRMLGSKARALLCLASPSGIGKRSACRRRRNGRPEALTIQPAGTLDWRNARRRTKKGRLAMFASCRRSRSSLSGFLF
jgi:hypothetical protein